MVLSINVMKDEGFDKKEVNLIQAVEAFSGDGKDSAWEGTCTPSPTTDD